MSDTTPSLTQAIEQLYTVFGNRETRAAVRAIPAAALVPFAESLMRNGLAIDDFRRVLPRALEVVALGDQGLDTGPLPIGIAIWYTAIAQGWESWGTDERDAILLYSRALWLCTLQSYPSASGISPLSLLATYAEIEQDLLPHLRIWTRLGTVSSMLHLRDLLMFHMMAIVKAHGFTRVFHPRHTRQAQQTVDWLVSDELCASIEDVFAVHSAGRTGNMLAELVDQLGALRAAFAQA